MKKILMLCQLILHTIRAAVISLCHRRLVLHQYSAEDHGAWTRQERGCLIAVHAMACVMGNLKIFVSHDSVKQLQRFLLQKSSFFKQRN